MAPTHDCSHTLDLVLSYGLCTHDLSISHLVDELLKVFQVACLTAINAVAPLKSRSQKYKRDLWLNDHVWGIRRRCRAFECKWKGDGLAVSRDLMRNNWIPYQKTVRVARSRYYPNIITSNRTNQCTLYKTINPAFSPDLFPPDPIYGPIQSFTYLFIEKVSNIRAHVQLSPGVFPPIPHCSNSLNHFDQITLDELHKLIAQMKPSGSPIEFFLSCLFKDMFTRLGPLYCKLLTIAYPWQWYPTPSSTRWCSHG